LIKINLLPVARVTKKVAVSGMQLQVVAAIAAVLVLVALCGYRWQMLSEQVVQQTQSREGKKVELVELKKKVAEVENYEKNKKLLENKNRVIEQLRKNQGGPVRLLDHISQSLEPLKIWLTSVDDGGAQITLEGRALATDDVVEFVKDLQRSNYFSSVLLEESRQATEDGLGIYQFRLRLAVKG
jgi:type IV pilus assembly protein PilN